MSSELDSISGFDSILGLPSVWCSQLHLGGICSGGPNFDRGYLENHWADGLHLLQARSTREDRVRVQYERQRGRSGRSSLEKPKIFREIPQFDLPAELNPQIHPMWVWS